MIQEFRKQLKDIAERINIFLDEVNKISYDNGDIRFNMIQQGINDIWDESLNIIDNKTIPITTDHIGCAIANTFICGNIHLANLDK